MEWRSRKACLIMHPVTEFSKAIIEARQKQQRWPITKTRAIIFLQGTRWFSRCSHGLRYVGPHLIPAGVIIGAIGGVVLRRDTGWKRLWTTKQLNAIRDEENINPLTSRVFQMRLANGNLLVICAYKPVANLKPACTEKNTQWNWERTSFIMQTGTKQSAT